MTATGRRYRPKSPARTLLPTDERHQLMKDPLHPSPAEDPQEKAVADGIESAIKRAGSIEEEMMLEAAELEEVEYRERGD